MNFLLRNGRFGKMSSKIKVGGNEPVRNEVRSILKDGKHPWNPKQHQKANRLHQLVSLAFGSLLSFIIYEEMSYERAKANADKKQHSHLKNVSLDDVIGIDEYKSEVQQVVDFFKDSPKYANVGADMIKGVLLYGKPGVGKTMLAKALANESSFNFIYSSGSEFADKYFGGTAKRVKEVFDEAEKKKPCIIFIDEIDSLGSKRGNDMNAGGGGDHGLNQLLHEMDGFRKHENIIVIGATNRIDSLDPALLRPGRFDTLIEIPSLNQQGRMKLFELYLTKINANILTIDKSKFLNKTQGFTGADIKNLFNLAAINAGYSNKPQVEHQDLEQAVDRILNGNKSETSDTTAEESLRQARIEAATAIVAHELGELDRLNNISVSRNTSKARDIAFKGKQGDQIFTRASLLNNLQLYASCQAAEELLYGPSQLSLSCVSRMKTARVLAREYIEAIEVNSENALPFIINSRSMSNEMLHEREQRVTSVVRQYTEKAKALLARKTEAWHKLASELLERKSLSSELVKSFLN